MNKYERNTLNQKVLKNRFKFFKNKKFRRKWKKSWIQKNGLELWKIEKKASQESCKNANRFQVSTKWAFIKSNARKKVDETLLLSFSTVKTQ